MDNEKIIQELNSRFAQPLPEFYERRIIFWHDEAGEFKDKIDEVVLENAEVVILTDKNMYTVKKMLCEDNLSSNYLVYVPLYFDKPEDNWLINVELYSGEEFRADLLSIWIGSMGLPTTPVIRELVKHYQNFFKAKDRREKLVALGIEEPTVSQIHLAVLAVLCGNKNIEPNNIVQAVLSAGLDNNENKIYQNFINYGAKDIFWKLVAQATGYYENEDSNLRRLAVHILLTAATRTMSIENLSGLESYISEAHQSWCYEFISEWLHSDNKGELCEIVTLIEREMHLFQRFYDLGIENMEDTEIFPCINKCILIEMLKDVKDRNIQVEVIRTIVEKRRTLAWYDDVSHYYEGLLYIAYMQEFYKNHLSGFHNTDPEQVWNEYINDYYKMDIYYRLFHINFLKGLNAPSDCEELGDLLQQAADVAEGLYSYWFLRELDENWSNICADKLKEFGYIPGIDQQENFYKEKVQPAGNRVYVIVSDALRYEVAAVLSEQLRKERQCKVILNNCEAVFPTATKFGMAALLPHKELNAAISETKRGKTLHILADGQSTDARNRERILKKAKENSVVLKSDDIIHMKRSERQDLVKGMEVIYIYHDKIDEASHVSDKAVFPACDEAINEIKNLVRIIVNDFGGTYIIITADHGFLYTYHPLGQGDQVDKTTCSDQDIEVDRRYLVTTKNASPKYLLPVKFLGGKTDYDVYTPRGNVRIRKKGGDSQFTHGGISLQEMVVPIVEYHHLRTVSKEYKKNRDKIDTKPVMLQLLSNSRKISNEVFYLDFYQKEPVGDNHVSCSYLLYFEDAEGKKISDSQRIIADRTNDNGKERTFHCRFNLRTQKYSNIAKYYLVIEDESGQKLPEKEEFTIDITLDMIRFDFSS